MLLADGTCQLKSKSRCIQFESNAIQPKSGSEGTVVSAISRSGSLAVACFDVKLYGATQREIPYRDARATANTTSKTDRNAYAHAHAKANANDAHANANVDTNAHACKCSMPIAVLIPTRKWKQ